MKPEKRPTLSESIQEAKLEAIKAGAGIACMVLSDEQLYQFFVDGYFKNQPNARQHLIHYRTMGGRIYEENLQALLNDNPRVRRRLSQLIKAEIKKDPTTQAGEFIGKGNDDGKEPPIRQSDYDSEDWRNANGGVDTVRWVLVGNHYHKNRDNLFSIYIEDPYQWHPLENRPTQCVHTAFERLKAQGASDYITIGHARVML